MIYRLVADLVLTVHLLFALFVTLGAFLVLRWSRVMWLHLPALLWGVLIEFAGFICPLTYLEDSLRELGAEAGYPGGFIDHYVVALLYPSALTRQLQIELGFAVLLSNLLIYGYLLPRKRR
jgi:hypothetical protein